MKSIRDVAEYCGVSTATVSNVINGKTNVSEKTAERVREAIEHLGYYPNFSASTLATGKTGIFGLFTGTAHAPYDEAVCAPLIKSLVMASHPKNMQVMVFYDTDQEKMNRMLSGRGPIDGAIILTPICDDFRVRNFKERQIPTVLIGTPSGGTDKDTLHVDVDNIRYTYETTSRLIEMGCRELLLLNSRADYSISQERNEGFYRALRKHGMRISDSMVVHINDDPEETMRTAEFFLENHRNCPGIISTCGCGRELVEKNRESELVVYDGTYDWVDYEELGSYAFDLLYRAISGENGLESIVVPHEVEPKGFLTTKKYQEVRKSEEEDTN